MLMPLLFGILTDSIESNVENAAVHVEQGNQQLVSAAQYQVCSTIDNFCLIVFHYLVEIYSILESKEYFPETSFSPINHYHYWQAFRQNILVACLQNGLVC